MTSGTYFCPRCSRVFDSLKLMRGCSCTSALVSPANPPGSRPKRSHNNTCPRCRVNRKALMDVREAMSLGQQRKYAPFCESCLVDDGWVKEEQHTSYLKGSEWVGYTYVFWEKPLPAAERAAIEAAVNAIPEDEFWASLNRPSQRDRDKAIEAGWRGRPATPSRVHMLPRREDA